MSTNCRVDELSVDELSVDEMSVDELSGRRIVGSTNCRVDELSGRRIVGRRIVVLALPLCMWATINLNLQSAQCQIPCDTTLVELGWGGFLRDMAGGFYFRAID